MNNKQISIPIKLDNAEEIIKQLEQIKQLIRDIKKLDNNFCLNNVINIDNNTTLIFNCNSLVSKEFIKETEEALKNKLKCECIILNVGLKLDKAIKQNEINYEKIIYYADGKPYKEETI